MKTVSAGLAIAVFAAAASADYFDIRMNIDETTSSAEITYGLDIFEPVPVFSQNLSSAIDGYIDIRVEVVDGRVLDLELVGGEAVGDSPLVASINDGSFQVDATLTGAGATLTDASPTFFTPSAAANQVAEFGFVLDLDFAGLLGVNLLGTDIGPFDLAGQDGSVNVNGEIMVLADDTVMLNLSTPIQGGDFGDPLFPGGPNAAYFGAVDVNLKGVLPAPGAFAALGFAGLAAARRRR